MKISFEGTVHQWAANPIFFLVSLPKEDSEELEDLFSGLTNGFGSLKVEATVGNTVWKTSIFPNTTFGVFGLPLKVEIRQKNGLIEGSTVRVAREILAI